MPPRLPTEAKDRRETRVLICVASVPQIRGREEERDAVKPRAARSARVQLALRVIGETALRRLYPATDYRDVDKCFMDDFRDNDAYVACSLALSKGDVGFITRKFVVV